MRPQNPAAIGQDRGGIGELQDGESVIALTDADRWRLSRQPSGLVALHLPGRRRQDAGGFAGHVDAGELPESPGFHEVVNAIDAELVGGAVVVGVGRDRDGSFEVDRAMAVGVRIAKPVAAEHEIARVVDGRRRAAYAVFQNGQCHEGLVGRTGRIGAPKRPVEHRLVGVFIERLPSLRVDPVDEVVRVEGGHRDEGQYFAGGRIDCDHRALALAVPLLHQTLQPDIDRQGEVLAGLRGVARQ